MIKKKSLNPLSGEAEERVAQRSVGGVSKTVSHLSPTKGDLGALCGKKQANVCNNPEVMPINSGDF